MTDLPSPLTPPECDLRDFPFMPLEVARLRRSKAWLVAKRDPAIAFYLINLWSAAWHDLPAGSLEDDDEVLADLAMCDARRWKQVKEAAMRGWIKCADGRLYHPVVAEKAMTAWNSKLKQRERTEAARKAKEANRIKRLNGGGQTPDGEPTDFPTESVTDNVTRIATRVVADSVTEPVTRSKREGEGERTSKDTGLRPDAVPASRDVRGRIWHEGLPILQRLTGKPQGASRALLGRLLRDIRDDAGALMAVLLEAERDAPADAVPWLVAAAKSRAVPKFKNPFFGIIAEEGITSASDDPVTNPITGFIEGGTYGPH